MEQAKGSLLKIFLGMPRDVEWRGKTLKTALWKSEPAEQKAWVRKEGIDGDRPGNPEVHGGAWKAVYSYASEHYCDWRKEFPNTEFAWGVFGENFLTEGLDEEAICVGDRIQVGERVILEAIEPRQPCFKLEARFAMQGQDGMMKNFLEAGRWGIYYRVLVEGAVAVGDPAYLVRRHPARIALKRVPGLRRAMKAGKFETPADAATISRLAVDGLF